MYKLLIADDDEIICQGLAACIPWGNHNTEVVDTVYDGEMALQSVKEHHPDIVLADINMPFMDGMEFSFQVKQQYPEIRIILITAYRDFEYARKAVELQVFDYVTKPFSNEDITGAVLRAQQSIEKERSMQKEIRKNIQTIRDRYLIDVTIYGKHDVQREAICGCLPVDGIYTVAILNMSLFTEEWTERFLVDEETAIRLAEEKVREFGKEDKRLKLFRYQNQMIFLFLNRGPDKKLQIQVYLKKVIGLLAKEDNLFLTCAVGRDVKGIANIPKSFAEALRALEYRYYFGHCSIIFRDDLDKLTDGEPVDYQEYLELACEGVREGSPEKLRTAIDLFFEKICRRAERKPASIVLMMMEFLLLTYRETQDTQLQESFLRGAVALYPLITKAADVEKMRQVVNRSFAGLFAYLEEKRRSSPEKLVQQAVAYMEEHFADPLLSLNEVADSVHISASYLCALFKQYHDNSYVNCLNRIRMEQAKRILGDRTYKTYEAAFLVGYNSSQYFSSAFKKYTGMTPGEYRSHIRK